MRQQCPDAAGSLFKPLMAAAREGPVAGKMEIALCLGGVGKLVACRIRQVEWDRFSCHFSNFASLQNCRNSGAFRGSQLTAPSGNRDIR
jgi:hypothetical protein